MKVICYLLISVFIIFPSLAGPLKLEPAAKNQQLLSLVTAVHVVSNENDKTTYRLVEVDESGSVAANPIKLFLVIDSGETGMPLLLKLPAVSELVSFASIDGKLILATKSDEMSETGTLSRGEVKKFVLSRSEVKKKITYWLTDK